FLVFSEMPPPGQVVRNGRFWETAVTRPMTATGDGTLGRPVSEGGRLVSGATERVAHKMGTGTSQTRSQSPFCEHLSGSEPLGRGRLGGAAPLEVDEQRGDVGRVDAADAPGLAEGAGADPAELLTGLEPELGDGRVVEVRR